MHNPPNTLCRQTDSGLTDGAQTTVQIWYVAGKRMGRLRGRRFECRTEHAHPNTISLRKIGSSRKDSCQSVFRSSVRICSVTGQAPRSRSRFRSRLLSRVDTESRYPRIAAEL